MKQFFHRLGVVLALCSTLAFTLHLHRGHGNTVNDASHHCCICHTVGITNVSAPESYQPPVFVSYRVAAIPAARPDAIPFHADSPRGPPTV